MTIKIFIEILNFLIFSQATIFGLQFILSKDRYRNILFLGILLVTIGITNFPSLFTFLDLRIVHKNLFMLFMLFLSIPFFYIHLLTYKKSNFHSKDFHFILPSIIAFITSFIILYFKIEIDTKYLSSLHILLFTGTFLNFFLALIIIPFVFNNLHKNEYSFKTIGLENLIRIYTALLFLSSYPILLIFNNNVYINIIVSSILLLLVYWFIIEGCTPFLIKKKTIKKETIAVLLPKNIEELQKKFHIINSYIEENEAYKKSSLTSKCLEGSIGIPSTKIAKAINFITGLNTKTYFNKLRIQKSIALLKSPEHKHYTIEAIGKEVGFESRTTFYRAFKKEMNCTPKEYQQKITTNSIS
ncbi:helix-turn-helix domain-containing protein [Tenacibaculum amylolyticum]|uniref:helix-turn-helix domain-containing protein n=1 Tax=Tenacibaculum amylolyticum TaxID=104269 RepID=UPI0038937174